MNDRICERVRGMAKQFVNNKTTVREVASEFGVSKSTAHKDLTERLSEVDPRLHAQVDELLQFNKSTRHIRGGNSTKEKYLANKNSTHPN